MSSVESLPSASSLPDDAFALRILRQAVAWFRRAPVTVVLSAAAILVSAIPGLAAGLQLDFASVAAGQWWRLLSGHLTHFGSEHLFWDLLMFAVLGVVCERQHPRSFGPALAVMALGISAAVTFLCDDVSGYRGLSGIDTGLFVWFIGDQIRQCFADRDRTGTSFWIATVGLLIGKLTYEFVTGEILFVNADGFKPLVESHLAGAAIGALFGSLFLRLPTEKDPLPLF